MAIELQRGLGPLWPAVCIIVGLLLAVLVQGVTDRGWIRQQRGWLNRLDRQAATADERFVAAATDSAAALAPVGDSVRVGRAAPPGGATPPAGANPPGEVGPTGTGTGSWRDYRIAVYVRAETAKVRADISAVIESRARWLRRLPWPEGYQSATRAAILARIVALDAFVAGWPGSVPSFQAAEQALAGVSPADEPRAAELIAQVRQLLSGSMTAAAPDLEKVAARIGSVPAALALIGQIVAQETALAELNQLRDRMSAGDQALLSTAGQQHRVAAGALAEADDVVDAVSRVGVLVTSAAVSIAGLPRAIELSPPVPVPVGGAPTDGAAVGLAPGNGAVAGGVPVLERGVFIDELWHGGGVGTALAFRVLAPLRQAGALLRAATPAATTGLLFVINLAVALWTGLVALYVGKPWGTPQDFLVAVAWGFGASTVLTPLLMLVRGLGTRPADPVTTPS